MAESGRTSDSGPPGTKTTFLNGKIDQALQKALGLENRPEIFNQIIQELQKFADQSFRFTMPIFPQETALVRFVEKSMATFPGFFGTCRENTELLHHLQRYGACYMAHKSGYFESHGRQSNTTRRSSFIKIPSKNVDNAQYNPPKRVTRTEAAVSSDAMCDGPGPAAIKAFLSGCHPPMHHLFQRFLQARITGEIHLQGLALWNDEDLRRFLTSNGGIAQTALEVEALIQGLARKKL